MADFKTWIEKALKWEGGWSDHVNDKGGKTNMGVTLSTWKAQGWDNDKDGDIDHNDLKIASKEQILSIAKKNYWDVIKGDQINNQAIASNFADWGWGSGPRTAAKQVQRILGLKDDGIVGEKTISAINSYPNQSALEKKIWCERKEFLVNITKRDPSQKVFLNGWLNRLNDFA